MKTSFLLSFSAILLCMEQTNAQTTEFEGTVHLNRQNKVYKVVTVPNCPQSYTPPPGTTATTITHETKYTNGKTEITVEDIVRPPGTAITINADRKIEIEITPSNGKANFYVEEKDKSLLYVNYWLNAKNEVAAGVTIQEWVPVYDCDGTPTMTMKTQRTLSQPETFYLMRVAPGAPETLAGWFQHADRIHVLNPAGGIVYYLVNRYNRDTKYILRLQNRQSIAYNSASLDLGALTIPFRYRPGFSRNGIKVKSDVSASFNIGVYGGYKLTKYSIINKAGTYTNRNLFSLRVGPFINVSTASLDSVNTAAGDIPMAKEDKQNIAVLSTGVGLMVDIKGVQIGLYGGWDFGLGSEAKNWNYHKRPWLGFGVGYKLTDLFAKKD